MFFKKKNKKSFVPLARTLLNKSCGVDDSDSYTKKIGLTGNSLEDFHINKRYLAMSTIICTAMINYDDEECRDFLLTFKAEKESRENIANAPIEIQDAHRKFDKMQFNTYLAAYKNLRKEINVNEPGFADKLATEFSKIFCAFSEKEEDGEFFNAGREIFKSNMRIARSLFLQDAEFNNSRH